MRLHFTLAEYKKFENKVVSSTSLSELTVMGPWFSANLEPENKDEFSRLLPPPLQFAMRKKWTPAFQRHQTLITSIYDPTVTPPHMLPPLPTCWCCA